jgi:hypothetical protein
MQSLAHDTRPPTPTEAEIFGRWGEIFDLLKKLFGCQGGCEPPFFSRASGIPAVGPAG